MGRNKAWLECDGQPLIHRQIALAREVGAAKVFISGRADGEYGALQCPVLVDEFPEAGPLAGIERALATTDAPLLLVLAVDLASMNAALLRRLLVHCARGRGAIPRVQGNIEPLAAFYPASAHAFAVLLLREGRNAVQGFAHECVAARQAVFFDLEPGAAAAFANWNSPADAGLE